jgi:hypothetical protein
MRMDAEALYDSILKVTGNLDPTAFGPPREVEATPLGEVIAKKTKAGWRRSIYLLQRRKTPVTMLEVFDLPPMAVNLAACRYLRSEIIRVPQGETMARVVLASGWPEEESEKGWFTAPPMK